MGLDQHKDVPSKPVDGVGDHHAAAAVSNDINGPGSTNKEFNAAKGAAGDTALTPSAKIDSTGITFSATSAGTDAALPTAGQPQKGGVDGAHPQPGTEHKGGADGAPPRTGTEYNGGDNSAPPQPGTELKGGENSAPPQPGTAIREATDAPLPSGGAFQRDGAEPPAQQGGIALPTETGTTNETVSDKSSQARAHELQNFPELQIIDPAKDGTLTRGFGQRTDSASPAKVAEAPDSQPNELPKTAADAQKILDQANVADKAKLSPDQSSQLKTLETGILSGDADATKAALESMRPLSFSANPSELADKNSATMDVFAKDMKVAGLSADFDPNHSFDVNGFKGTDSDTRHFEGPIGSLHLSDHAQADLDGFHNKSFTDLAMSTSTPNEGFSEQSVPRGNTMTPDFVPISQGEALHRLGEVAQKNLGVLPSGQSIAGTNPQSE